MVSMVILGVVLGSCLCLSVTGMFSGQSQITEIEWPVSKTSDQNETADGRIRSLERSIAILQSRVDNLTVQFHKDSHSHQRDPVVFYAVLPETTVLNKKSVIQFSEVLINEGEHYNSYDGIFVAPVSGLYQFAWTTYTMTGKQVFSELRVESDIMSDLHTSLGTGAIAATRVIVCRVNKGDHVWIQTGSHYSENYFYAPNGSQSSFMGLLIKEL